MSMTIYRSLFLLSSLLLPAAGVPQVSVGFGVSYCTFSMKDLKALNEEFATNDGVPAQIVQQFPPYMGLDALVGYGFGRHRTGIFWSYNSTGSRVTYQDYSGQVQYDQLLH